jgi:phosphoglycolate phosphatase (TIGR01487 family)
VLKGLVTDIDGTLTDPYRRIHTGAIERIRELCDHGILVVLASGNTSCFMDALSKMIGTQGAFIAENGGVYRTGYTQPLRIVGNQAFCREALDAVTEFYKKSGVTLDLYSPTYRFADLAFARTVPVDEVREIVKEFPVDVLDTGFAIHLQARGVTKGLAFLNLVSEMGLDPSDFLAAGDAENDVELIKYAGIGIAVNNAPPAAAAVASYVSEKKFGDGFLEAIDRYMPYFLER